MANKLYNKQTAPKLQGNPPPKSGAGSKHTAFPMKCPDWPSELGGPTGGSHGPSDWPLVKESPEQEGLG